MPGGNVAADGAQSRNLILDAFGAFHQQSGDGGGIGVVVALDVLGQQAQTIRQGGRGYLVLPADSEGKGWT